MGKILLTLKYFLLFANVPYQSWSAGILKLTNLRDVVKFCISLYIFIKKILHRRNNI